MVLRRAAYPIHRCRSEVEGRGRVPPGNACETASDILARAAARYAFWKDVAAAITASRCRGSKAGAVPFTCGKRSYWYYIL